jgi:hypothetical protein
VHTLTLRVLDRGIRIDCAQPEMTALVTAAYGHMRHNQQAIDLHYTVGRDDGTFFAERPGRERLSAPDDGTFIALFDEEIAIELQKLRRDLYFVHAAVLTISDAAFMLVAEPGGGKSTLCWALSHHGFRYLSDEFAPVTLETLKVHRFTRALTLKTKTPAPYPIPPTALRTTRGWHVSAEDVPSGVGEDLTRLRAIFFVQYDAQAREPAVRPISAAEAAARLYANTLNALAHTADGLDAAIRITTAVSAFDLVTADLAATCALLTATLKGLLESRG